MRVFPCFQSSPCGPDMHRAKSTELHFSGSSMLMPECFFALHPPCMRFRKVIFFSNRSSLKHWTGQGSECLWWRWNGHPPGKHIRIPSGRKSQTKCMLTENKFLPVFQTSNLLDGPRSFPGFFLSLLDNREVTSNFLSPCSRLWCREVFNKAPCFFWWPSLVQVWFYCFWLKAVSELTEQILL